MHLKALIFISFVSISAAGCSALPAFVSRLSRGRTVVEAEPKQGTPAWRALAADPRVAVLRLSGEGSRQAAERVREELVRSGYAVLSGLATDRELAKHKFLGVDPLKSPARRKLGQGLKVRAAIVGRVERAGENPLRLRVELEWFDFEQDKVLWRGRATYEAGKFLRRAFLEEAIGLAVEKLVGLLPPAVAGAGGKGVPER